MWVYFLKSKVQALEEFKGFKKLVENEHNSKIKCLRSDRGGEFTSRNFNQFCISEGVKRQLTTPYTPHHNGMVERRNRTILNMTRCMLKAMKVPQDFWAEAVRHAVYLLNRLPSNGNENGTPYESLKGRKPTVKHIKVFGCVAHAKAVKPNQRKLKDRSLPMVYLGIEEGSKGCRLYDPQNNKVVISKDNHFKEDRVWDWSDYTTSSDANRNCWVDFDVQIDEIIVSNFDQESS